MSDQLPKDEQDEMLTLHSGEEVCRYAAEVLGCTGLTPKIVGRAAREGELEYGKVTRAFWYSKRAVRDWLRGPTSLPEGFDQ